MIRQRSATVLSRDGLSLARDAGSPTSSESEEPAVAGGSSSPGSSRCASPTRRGNSRLQFFAVDVRPDSPAQRRDKIMPYGGGLERIPSGELGDMCDMGDRGAALFGHRRGRRLAAVVVTSIVILCCVFSRSSSLALAVNGEGNDAAGRRSAPATWQGTASPGAESGDKHGLRPFRMLTVCTGNTCRSPMMMALLRVELQRLGLKNILVESAGTGEKAALRRPASPHALTLFPEQLKDHQSRRITEKHLSVYDRIFCMTDAHKDAVVEQCMQEAKNASYLRHNGGGARDVAEPEEESLTPQGGAAMDSRETFAGTSSGSNVSAFAAGAHTRMETGAPLAAVSGWQAIGERDGVELELEGEEACNERVSVFPGGLDDPYNKSFAEYDECAHRLRGWVSEVMATLPLLLRGWEQASAIKRGRAGAASQYQDSMHEV